MQWCDGGTDVAGGLSWGCAEQRKKVSLGKQEEFHCFFLFYYCDGWGVHCVIYKSSYNVSNTQIQPQF
jgi:hypothetical protein